MNILLKHKRQLTLITFLSWTAAAFYYFGSTPPCVSEAKLLVRYVIEPDDRGPATTDLVVNAEMEFLTSRDVAERAVEKVGVRRLASKRGEPADPPSLIAEGLTVSAGKGSTVIRIAFKHADAATAQAALQAVIDACLEERLKIHRIAAGPGDLRESAAKSLALISSSAVFGRNAAQPEVDGKWATIPTSNVAVVQQPTPGLPDTTRRNQILIGLVIGGPVLGMLGVLALGPVRRPRPASI